MGEVTGGTDCVLDSSAVLVRMLPLLLLSHITLTFAAPTSQCDLNKLSIDGGNYTLSDGGNIGSRVLYSCSKGKYPYPTISRECLPSGRWTHATHQFTCRDVLCPAQMTFEMGDYFPRKRKYYIGDALHFDCYAGFERFGPEKRTCQEDGKWSGTTPTCENFLGYCPNPGIPAGARKSGTSYDLNSKISYQCQDGLYLTGSAERQCMKNKRWSGTEPVCRERYVYDSPEEVAESFSYSLAESIARAKPIEEESTNRRIAISKDAPLNIFIVFDTSASVGLRNFNTAKEIAAVLIEKVSTYDIRCRYAVISYASEVKIIVNLNEEDSGEPEAVITRIQTFNYREHEGKTGTNTRDGLQNVYNMLGLEKLRNPGGFLSTRNIIVHMTDGKFNMGGDPRVEIKRIRELLAIGTAPNDREDYLDVYSFGLGDDISIEELNDLASKKDFEKHVFRMESIDDMKSAFDYLIDETEAFDMCGLSKEHSEDTREKFPWTAKITVTRSDGMESAKGSIITRNFILTAAHVFRLDDAVHTVFVQVGDRAGFKVKNIYRHPKYDPTAKQDKNIRKSFDYDLALVELDRKLDFSSTIRPICLPCTSGASWALKLTNKPTTCTDHENVLFPKGSDLIEALFISEETRNELKEMNVYIKEGTKRIGCDRDTAKLSEFKDVADIKDVTDKFLCTGGTQPVLEPQTCKEDAGGPLIIRHKRRYIQVGVISWETINSCRRNKRERVPEGSRDFHADVLHSMDWIGKITKDELSLIK
ncbi:complement factor B-like [Hyperolius riggenbachi]|uniref:complement factor B-like n=1 Tax=Hyperolius riggenbachi TaxID=752182 RepID=UPI0035A3C070